MQAPQRLGLITALTAALGAGFVMLPGCAGTGTRGSTGQYIDDSAITTQVKARFAEDAAVSALNIQVETFKGAVQLSGFANSEAEISRAVQLASDVQGVRAVRNDIRLKG